MAPRKTKPATYRRPGRRRPDLALEDIPEIRAWMVAERGEFYRPLKEQITLRLDKDVIAWFKTGGEGYQTRINEVLREYVMSRVFEEKGKKKP